METFITNPSKKKHGKSHRKGKKSHRRNPLPIPNTGKRRGSARRGMRSNPSFGVFVPGGLGGLVFRAGLKLAAGDEGIRGSDGKLTTKALGIGALMLYFGDKVADLLKQTGSDSIAFQGGQAGIAVSLLADDKMPDLAREYLAPLQSPTKTSSTPAATGAQNGLAGTRERPMSLQAYQQMAGMGALPAIGVVYVQGADGAVYEVPTQSGAVSGPESIEIPAGIGAGYVLRRKSDGARFRVQRDSSGALDAQPLGLSGSIADYQNAA
ncbi:MAG: hypothetical protein PHW08_14155 [Kiritimatiellae bacterium]|nr:hypothetical protein [Kiritimatiellia bacterium]